MLELERRIIGGEFPITICDIVKHKDYFFLEDEGYYYSSGRCALYTILRDIGMCKGGGTTSKLFMRLGNFCREKSRVELFFLPC